MLHPTKRVLIRDTSTAVHYGGLVARGNVNLLDNLFVFLHSILLFQRQAKYSENKLKCTKARNDYLLNLAATNAAVSKYYIHDVSDLIDVSYPSLRMHPPLFLLASKQPSTRH